MTYLTCKRLRPRLMMQAGTPRICHASSHHSCIAVSMLQTHDSNKARTENNSHADTLETAGKLLFLSTPLPQPHAPADTEDGMGSLHQSAGDQDAGMPAIPTSPLMATPHHVAAMHVGKPQMICFALQAMQRVAIESPLTNLLIFLLRQHRLKKPVLFGSLPSTVATVYDVDLSIPAIHVELHECLRLIVLLFCRHFHLCS